MKKEWVLVEIVVPGAAVEIAAAVLAECGCQGTVTEDRTLDTFVVPDDELDAEQIYSLKAYFEESGAGAQLVATLRDAFAQIPVLVPWGERISFGGSVKMEDWAHNWKQNFSSFCVGESLLFKPSWEVDVDIRGKKVIEIDPGMAFGTGTHGTTRLCLEVIAELFAASEMPATVLDVGTGSGILALGAAALGCRKILANDLDPVACEVARENIEKNGYGQQIQVTEEALEVLSGKFDLVVANILAEENVRLKQPLFEHLAPGGWLVLSGILKEKESFVRSGFADMPLRSFPARYQDEWVCLVYQWQG
jgi:ribosomal protein L11 methyltransferase